MPETMNINGRGPIHGAANLLAPQDTEESFDDEESQDIQNDSHVNYHTESGSDYEASDTNAPGRSPIIPRRKSVDPLSQRRIPQKKHERSKTPYVPESFTLNVGKRSITTPLNDSCNGFYINFLVGGAIIIAVAVIVMLKPLSSEPEEKKCSYEELQDLYPQQSFKTWRTLKFGIESILNKRGKSPEIYLFIHHDGKYMGGLVKKIASHTTSCFGKAMRPVELENSDFTSDQAVNDYGYAIEKYKAKIKEGSVILIANLNQIPAQAARALHAICDTINPIDPDVVIFLTLTIPDINEGNVQQVAEDTLVDLWGQTLERSELDPLITRVTYQVIALNS